MPAHELGPHARLGDEAAIAELLRHGEIDVEGRLPWSSNATFRVDVRLDGAERKAIYKPVRGERPLWDFPPGLHRREVAAYALSESLGLGLVPPTVIRDDGPYGEGSLQLFVDVDHQHHYFTIFESCPETHDQLRAMALFDIVANNTDRKSGHCLVAGGKIWGIDHGLCFAVEFKLRTVIWDFAGEPIPAPLLDAVAPLSATVPPEVAELLSVDEVDALRRRVDAVLAAGVFPVDPTGRRYPWPLV